MKKLVLVSIFFAVWCAIPAQALLTLTVTGGSPVNIRAVRIGQDNFKAESVKLLCQQDTANDWQLSISADSDLIDARTGYAIPMENMKWYGAWTDSTTGGFVNGTGGTSVPLSQSPDAVFSDGLAAAGVQVQVGLGVVIPEAQPQGTYRAKVQFVMTE